MAAAARGLKLLGFPRMPLATNLVGYESVYSRGQTRLVEKARAAPAPTANGLSLRLH